MRVLVVASHSAGHIWPAVAFCQGLRDKDSAIDINFISTKGEIESKVLGDNFNPILFKKEKIGILNAYSLIPLFSKAGELIDKLKPDLIVGFGGYLSIPFVICAHLRKIPNFIHEQNYVMGLANKFLAKFSDRIVFSFPNLSLISKLKHRALFLGLPLRKEIRRIDKNVSLNYFGLDNNRFTLLVTGGSQGSVNINTHVINLLRNNYFSDIQVIHITGLFDYERVKKEYSAINVKHKILPFLDEMEHAFNACDLAICRAGAGTIAEIIFLGVPVILVPYPFAKSHQLENASFLCDKGAAVLIKNEDLDESKLKEKVIDLRNNSDKLRGITDKLKELNIYKAREDMADLAFQLFR
jgi:UDP-N-acetylglucosamine--N-acetylmuramyl-(pentapeptide) pyrophosphoryl-undecaprenol N-acetylglucosamine transferase